jgi:hypothetical protein
VVALYKLEKTIDKLERASLWKLALKLVTILYENENFYMFSFNWSFNACSTSSSDGKETTGGTPYQHLLHLLLFWQMLKLLTKFKRCTKVFLGICWTNSKLARERYYTTNPGFESNIVTTGGSGFGLMTHCRSW